MSSDNGQNFSTPPMGAMETKTERYQAPSGQTAELRWIETVVFDGGFKKKDSHFEVVPPLSDGRVPERTVDIRECRVCLGLYHADNVLFCPCCGRYCCNRCLDRGVNGFLNKMLCSVCGEESRRGLLSRISRKFWNLEG